MSTNPFDEDDDFVDNKQISCSEISTLESDNVEENLNLDGAHPSVVVQGCVSIHPAALNSDGSVSPVIGYFRELGFVRSASSDGNLPNLSIMSQLPSNDALLTHSRKALFRNRNQVSSTQVELTILAKELFKNNIGSLARVWLSPILTRVTSWLPIIPDRKDGESSVGYIIQCSLSDHPAKSWQLFYNFKKVCILDFAIIYLTSSFA